MSHLFPTISESPDYPPGVNLVDIGVEEEAQLEEADDSDYTNYDQIIHEDNIMNQNFDFLFNADLALEDENVKNLRSQVTIGDLTT